MEGPQTNEDMFQHKPLKHGRHIRLIHLELPRKISEPLRCQIKEVCLDDNPEYSAMSYAWDAEIPTVPLICGGKRLLITSNCEKGLRRFAKTPAGQVMWVDSICIDQYSTSDRNHQVQLMGAIYSQAATVLVWLGETDERTSYGFDQLRNLGEHGTSSERTSQAFRDEEIAKRTDMIPRLFERSWFQRLWVIQEVSLPNPSQVLVFCGNTYIRWKHFVRGVLKFGELSASGIPECMDVFIYLHGLLGPNRRFAGSGFNRLDSRSSERTVMLEVRRPLTMFLSKVTSKKCQDPRDRFFALNSVFRALPIEGSGNAPKPDYRQSYQDVEHAFRRLISLIEGEGTAGIETPKIECPQGSRAASKSHIEAISMPLPEVSHSSRRELCKTWGRYRRDAPLRMRLELLFDDDVFPALIEEARCCWVMSRWIKAILDLTSADSEVNEYRATGELPLSCIHKLQTIFCEFSSSEGVIRKYNYDFQTWANTVFSIHELDFSVLNEAASEDANQTYGKILTDRSMKFGHWWEALGPLNTSLTKIQTVIMENCCGRSLFVSREGDLVLFEVPQMQSMYRREKKPTFLVRYENPVFFTVLQEFKWTWAEGRLQLHYNVLTTTIDLNKQAGVGILDPEALLTLEGRMLRTRIMRDANAVVYIPKKDILPDRKATKGETREVERGYEDTIANRLSEIDITAVTREGVISYGSEDALNAWWPSWFL